MSSPAPTKIFKHVKYFRADDRRPVAIFIGGDFDEFDKFRPFMESEEEIRHVREAYKSRIRCWSERPRPTLLTIPGRFRLLF